MTDTDPTPDRPRPPATGPVQYRGEDLEAGRGPGLGCFRFQAIVLVVLLVLTPLTVVWEWPAWISAVLLFAIIGLLLITGQTIIFLLRLVAADRRGRRRPLASGTKTIGELEDEQSAAQTKAEADPTEAAPASGVEPTTGETVDPATKRDESGPP